MSQIPLIFSIIALLVSLGSVGYQAIQKETVAQKQEAVNRAPQNELAVHTMLTERNARILGLMLEHAETRPYFYDNAVMPTKKILLGKTLTLAEIWTDFFEQMLSQEEQVSFGALDSWRAYAVDMHGSSTAIKSYFDGSCRWYSLELQELWGGCKQ